MAPGLPLCFTFPMFKRLASWVSADPRRLQVSSWIVLLGTFGLGCATPWIVSEYPYAIGALLVVAAAYLPVKLLVEHGQTDLAKIVGGLSLVVVGALAGTQVMQTPDPPIEDQWEAHGEAKGRREAQEGCSKALDKASSDKREAIQLEQTKCERQRSAQLTAVLSAAGPQGRKALVTSYAESSAPVIGMGVLRASVPEKERPAFDAFFSSETERVETERARIKAAEEAKAKAESEANARAMAAEDAKQKAKEADRYNAPLRCGDGTMSPTCTCGRGNRVGNYRGCCSHHHGVAGCSVD